MAYQNIVARRLKEHRESKRWTQELLARKCSNLGWRVSENTIAKIESGHRKVSDKELRSLAYILEVGVEELFPEERHTHLLFSIEKIEKSIFVRE